MKAVEILTINGSDCVITIGEKMIKEVEKGKNEVSPYVSSIVIYRKIYDEHNQFHTIEPIYLNYDEINILADKINEVESRANYVIDNDDLPF